MGSRKGSARAKRQAQFKAQLGGMDDVFAAEGKRAQARAQQKQDALRKKACSSKNRYSCKGEADAAILQCAQYGTTGLHSYRCQFCNGWHLTSKPPRS